MGMFKKALGILILTVSLGMSSCTATKSVQDTTTHENLIIYYAPDAGNKELLGAAKKYGSEVLYVYQNINGIAVTVPSGKSVSEAVRYYEKVKGVLSVTRDQKMQLD